MNIIFATLPRHRGVTLPPYFRRNWLFYYHGYFGEVVKQRRLVVTLSDLFHLTHPPILVEKPRPIPQLTPTVETYFDSVKTHWVHLDALRTHKGFVKAFQFWHKAGESKAVRRERDICLIMKPSSFQAILHLSQLTLDGNPHSHQGFFFLQNTHSICIPSH